jgi:hypothetical protein
VYGVLRAEADVSFDSLRGVDSAEAVFLIRDGEVAAIASSVELDEFGEEPIAERLRDAQWLAEKARAHDDVLAAALARTTVLPFRFGAIYLGEEQVRVMLREHPDFAETLRTLEGVAELGVKAFTAGDALRARLAAQLGAGEGEAASGRAYMQRKQLERRLAEAAAEFTTECAHVSHERLAAVASDARMNPLRTANASADEPELILNGAYLVPEGDTGRFRDVLTELEERYGSDGVTYELTGPWPPYNFVDVEGRP